MPTLPEVRTKLARYNSRVDLSRLDTEGVENGGPKSTPSVRQTPDAAQSGWADFWPLAFLTYYVVGSVIGAIAGIIAFIGVYVAAVGSVGWVFGIALGWIPAMLAGGIAYGFFKWLWPLIAIGVIAIVYMAIAA
jgi:hypothetical protein